MPSARYINRRVHLADLVDDVPVHADFPVEIVPGVLPCGLAEFEPGDEQAVGVGGHAIEIADAELVVLRARAGDATDEAVRLGVLVDARHITAAAAPEPSVSDANSANTSIGSFAVALEASDGGLLGVAAALAVDDERVVDRCRRRSPRRRSACR